jgi:hemerythrin
MAIAWSPRLALGVDAIDAQHQELFLRVNALLAALERQSPGDELRRLVDFLGGYVARHFADEERLMQRNGYPDYASHRQQHEAFVAEFGALKAELQRGGASAALAVQVNHRICSWLLEHIGHVDRALATYLAGRAAARP